MSYNTAERFGSDVSKINHGHISKLKFKLQSLGNCSSWEKNGCVDHVVNVSKTTLRTAETEAFSFGLKFTAGMKNQIIGKLIDMNYRRYDSDFHKGFVQDKSATSTNCQIDELTQLRRYLAALKTLFHHNNIILLPSNKGSLLL